MSRFWRGARWALALTIVSTAATAAAQPPARTGPPVGEERARLLEGIHKSYPHIPDNVANLMADARRQITDNSRCELVEWLVRPEAKAPAAAVERARPLTGICALGIDHITADAASKRLAGKSFAFDIAGGELTMIAHAPGKQAVEVCCSLQMPLSRVGASDYWAGRRRLPHADEALLTLGILAEGMSLGQTLTAYRGPKAPAEPPVLKAGLKGQVLKRELKSQALGETRRLGIYLPPGWSASKTWPALFLTDGGAEQFAPLIEALITQGKIRPIVLIGAESGERGVVGEAPKGYGPDLRSAEYIRAYPEAKDRFDRHMAFFSGELTDYAAREFSVSRKPEDRAVAGYSNGGVFSLWAGLMHPEVFAMAAPMSPGVAPVGDNDLKPGPRAAFWISGGLYEPPFHATAKAAEAKLKAAGYKVSGLYLAAGHMSDQWELALYEAVQAMFPPAMTA